MPLAWLWSVVAFACDSEAEEAIRRFRTASRSPEVRARAAAVAELGRIQHDKTLAKLLSVLGTDDKAVRIAAAQAVGGFKDWRKQATSGLLAALAPNARLPEVQAAIFAAVAALGDESALPAIHAAFREKDARVAQAAIEATGTVRSAASIDPLLALLKDLEKFMKNTQPGGYEGPSGVGDEAEQQQRLKSLHDAAIKAIQSITKDSWTTLEEWQIWWKRRKATFKVEK